jgi:K+/H+ antiporter YhaU regulatory subunit KhtT
LLLTAAITAGLLVFNKVVRGIGNMLAAYAEQEKAENALAVALRNTGQFTLANIEHLKQYAAALQQVTTFGDEETIAVMANLTAYGMNIQELEAATKATMDLAIAKKIDLRTASELVGKAFVGETGTLSRYGIVLDASIPKTEKFAAVLDLINQRFGGAAQAEVDTYAGKVQQLKNAWGDLGELIGGLLVPVLTDVVVWLKTIIEAAQTAVKWIGKLVGIEKVVDELEQLQNRMMEINQETERLYSEIARMEGVMFNNIDLTSERYIRIADLLAERTELTEQMVMLEQKMNDEAERNLKTQTAITHQRTEQAAAGGGLGPFTRPGGIPGPPIPGGGMSAMDQILAEAEAQQVAADMIVESIRTVHDFRMTAWQEEIAMMEEMAFSQNKLAEATNQLSIADNFYIALRGAVAGAIAQSILGYQSLGAALKQATAQILAQLAAEAAIRAVLHTAFGVAALTPWGAAAYGPAAAQFKSAALFAIVAAMAGGAAAALSSGGPSAAESRGFQEARGAGVEALAREGERQEVAQRWEVTIINPIGTNEWVEDALIPEIKKLADRDHEIVIQYST